MTHTVGQRLKTKREEKRLTLEKVFEATRIRVQYLQALETDDLSVMPSPVQARGYFRNYAEYLGLDVEQMLEQMRLMNAQQTSGEVIGPADPLPLPPPEEVKPKPVASQPVPPPPALTQTVDDQPVPLPIVEELTIPIKPKPARRKKEKLLPEAASAEAPTRRRGRKKAEPEAVSVIETNPEPVEEPVTSVEPASQPERVAEVPAASESVSLP